jgi:hypothetical protein
MLIRPPEGGRYNCQDTVGRYKSRDATKITRLRRRRYDGAGYVAATFRSAPLLSEPHGDGRKKSMLQRRKKSARLKAAATRSKPSPPALRQWTREKRRPLRGQNQAPEPQSSPDTTARRPSRVTVARCSMAAARVQTGRRPSANQQRQMSPRMDIPGGACRGPFELGSSRYKQLQLQENPWAGGCDRRIFFATEIGGIVLEIRMRSSVSVFL